MLFIAHSTMCYDKELGNQVQLILVQRISILSPIEVNFDAGKNLLVGENKWIAAR